MNLIEHGILVELFGGQVSGSNFVHRRSNEVSAWRPSTIHMQGICTNTQWAEVSIYVCEEIQLIIMHLEIYFFKVKHHPYYVFRNILCTCVCVIVCRASSRPSLLCIRSL